MVGAKLLLLLAVVPKGKTTAAIGQGFRATGHGFKVYMIQFMKGYPQYGEVKAIGKMPNFELKQFGTPDLIATPGDISLDRKGHGFAKTLFQNIAKFKYSSSDSVHRNEEEKIDYY